MSYDYRNDRMVGHDYPGVHGSGFVQWELDELELGARVAMLLDDPEQAWWETIGQTLLDGMRNE
jgi:hypothetical protein